MLPYLLDEWISVNHTTALVCSEQSEKVYHHDGSHRFERCINYAYVNEISSLVSSFSLMCHGVQFGQISGMTPIVIWYIYDGSRYVVAKSSVLVLSPKQMTLNLFE